MRPTDNNDDLHAARYHGTEFVTERVKDSDPIRRGVLEIEGVILQIAVFPERTSLAGNVYNPVSIRYAAGNERRLVSVPID